MMCGNNMQMGGNSMQMNSQMMNGQMNGQMCGNGMMGDFNSCMGGPYNNEFERFRQYNWGTNEKVEHCETQMHENKNRIEYLEDRMEEQEDRERGRCGQGYSRGDGWCRDGQSSYNGRDGNYMQGSGSEGYGNTSGSGMSGMRGSMGGNMCGNNWQQQGNCSNWQQGSGMRGMNGNGMMNCGWNNNSWNNNDMWSMYGYNGDNCYNWDRFQGHRNHFGSNFDNMFNGRSRYGNGMYMC